jgi:hypothetical protein
MATFLIYERRFRLLHKRMQVTRTAWVDSLKAGHDYPAENMNVTHYMTFFPLVAICYKFHL